MKPQLIDQDDGVGIGSDDRLACRFDGALHAAIGLEAIDEAQNCKPRHVDVGRDAALAHLAAADAGNADGRIGGAQRIDHIGAEGVAGVFRRDEKDVAHASFRRA